jgi:pimeloyl-ACP methyl ester carboxylesterase
MSSLLKRYKEDISSARMRLQAESQIHQTLAGPVEAALAGHGSPVLISHGSGGGYDMGLWLGRLIGGQFQYVAPSRFGYLRSPVPSLATPKTQADIYAALLDTLGVRSAIVIGLSGGGASALQFALCHPERCRGLVMISAVSRPVPPLPRFLRVIYPLMLKSDFIPWLLYNIAPQTVFQANGVSRGVLARIKQDQEKMGFLDALYQTTFPSTLRRDGMLTDMEQMTRFPEYPLERITTPTLVIHATDDPIIPFASGEFSASIPNAQFLRLEDGGHFVCATHREVTVPMILEFLNQHGS